MILKINILNPKTLTVVLPLEWGMGGPFKDESVARETEENFIVEHGCKWLYNVVHSRTRLQQGCARLCMVLHGCTWLYMAVLSCTWLNMVVKFC